MKYLHSLLCLLVPGSSSALAGTYVRAFAVPIIGLSMVFLFSITRWVVTPSGFAAMLIVLVAWHFINYWIGILAIFENKLPRRYQALTLIALVAVNLSIIVSSHVYKAQIFGFSFYHIPSPSMEPTLQVGDVVLVNTWDATSADRKVIVVKRHQHGIVLAKRITKIRRASDGLEIFIEGDNSLRSIDSRKFGWIAEGNIIAKVEFVWFSFRGSRWFQSVK
jgi:hypothetical protein